MQGVYVWQVSVQIRYSFQVQHAFPAFLEPWVSTTNGVCFVTMESHSVVNVKHGTGVQLVRAIQANFVC